MKLVEFVPPTPHPLWELCPQMGITDVIVKVNPELTGLPDPWKFETLASIVSRLKSAGLKVVGLEGDPFDMSPIKEFGVGEDFSHKEHKDGLFTNDNCHNCSQITNTNSTRSTCSTRLNNPVNLVNPVKENLILSHEQVWANYEYFIKAVMPTAEKWGIRMGLHPDDPCLESLGGYARIFGSIDAYDRAYSIYPSPSNAVTFCQANFKLMFTNVSCHTNTSSTCSTRLNDPTKALADAARHFGKRIAFIHIRDVEGDKTDFTELFHDQGDVDQFALMRVYRELGLDVPVRGDHVPEMAYDRMLTPEGTPGYFTLGRLFANGYLKALCK